jgi:hypothetical protein
MAKEKVAPIKYPEITKAGERYIEQYGDPLVTNTYLKVTVLILALVIAGDGGRDAQRTQGAGRHSASDYPH